TEDKQDLILFNGEEYDIPTGLTDDEIRESMNQVVASAKNAHIERTLREDGTTLYTLTEKGGDKG
ncbi:unnamed protein product, partial [marine sediment metagenome]